MFLLVCDVFLLDYHHLFGGGILYLLVSRSTGSTGSSSSSMVRIVSLLARLVISTIRLLGREMPVERDDLDEDDSLLRGARCSGASTLAFKSSSSSISSTVAVYFRCKDLVSAMGWRYRRKKGLTLIPGTGLVSETTLSTGSSRVAS